VPVSAPIFAYLTLAGKWLDWMIMNVVTLCCI
jgi:hypothetical protein